MLLNCISDPPSECETFAELNFLFNRLNFKLIITVRLKYMILTLLNIIIAPLIS